MKLLSTAQAAVRLGVSERRVRSLITEGKLLAYKMGRDYVIEEQALQSVKVYGKSGRPRKSKKNSIPKESK
jgi:excisionase family DNA binding protein